MDIKGSIYQLNTLVGGAKDSPQDKVVLYSLRKSMGVTITKFAKDLLVNGEYTQLPDNLFNIFMYHELVVPEQEDERGELLHQLLLRSEDIKQSEITCLLPLTEYPETRVKNIQEEVSRKFIGAKRYINKKINLHLHHDTLMEAVEPSVQVSSEIEEMGLPAYIGVNKRLISFGLGGSAQDLLAQLTSSNIYYNDIKLILRGGQENINSTSLFDQLDQLRILLSQSLSDVVGRWEVVLVLSASQISNLHEYTDLLQTVAGKATMSMVIDHRISAEHHQQYILEERSLLQKLDELSIGFNMIPAPSQRVNEGLSGEQLLLRINDPILHIDLGKDGWEISERPLSDKEWVSKIEKEESPCASCKFLFVCGGNHHKHALHDNNCPSFIHEFHNKALLKYTLPQIQEGTHDN